MNVEEKTRDLAGVFLDCVERLEKNPHIQP